VADTPFCRGSCWPLYFQCRRVSLSFPPFERHFRLLRNYLSVFGIFMYM
jgi:hypothetical protein